MRKLLLLLPYLLCLSFGLMAQTQLPAFQKHAGPYAFATKGKVQTTNTIWCNGKGSAQVGDTNFVTSGTVSPSALTIDTLFSLRDSLVNWVFAQTPLSDNTYSTTLVSHDTIHLYAGINQLAAGTYRNNVLHLHGADTTEFVIRTSGNLNIDSLKIISDTSAIKPYMLTWIVSGVMVVDHAPLFGTVISDSLSLGGVVRGQFSSFTNKGLTIAPGLPELITGLSPYKYFGLGSIDHLRREYRPLATTEVQCGRYTNGRPNNLVVNGSFEDYRHPYGIAVTGRWNFNRIIDRWLDLPACGWNALDEENTPDLFHTEVSAGGGDNRGVCLSDPQFVNIPQNYYGVNPANSYNTNSGNVPVKAANRIVISRSFGNDIRESICQKLPSAISKGNYIVGFGVAGVANCSNTNIHPIYRYTNVKLPISAAITEGRPMVWKEVNRPGYQPTVIITGNESGPNGYISSSITTDPVTGTELIKTVELQPAATVKYAVNQVLTSTFLNVRNSFNVPSNHNSGYGSYLTLGYFDNYSPPNQTSFSGYSIADVYLYKIPEIIGSLNLCTYTTNTPLYAGISLPSSFNPTYRWEPAAAFVDPNILNAQLIQTATAGQYTLTVTYDDLTGETGPVGDQIVTRKQVTSTGTFGVFSTVVGQKYTFCRVGDSQYDIPTELVGCHLEFGPGLFQSGTRFGMLGGSTTAVLRSYITAGGCAATQCKRYPVLLYPTPNVTEITPPSVNYTNCANAPSNTEPVYGIRGNATTDYQYKVKVYDMSDINNPVLLTNEFITVTSGNWSPSMLVRQVPLDGKLRFVFVGYDLLENVETDCQVQFDYIIERSTNTPQLSLDFNLKAEIACPEAKAQLGISLVSGPNQPNNTATLNGVIVDANEVVMATIRNGNLMAGITITGLLINTNVRNADKHLTFRGSYIYDNTCQINFYREIPFQNCCDIEIQEEVQSGGYEVLGTDENTPIYIHSDDPNPFVINKNTIVLSPIIVDFGAKLIIEDCTVKFKGIGRVLRNLSTQTNLQTSFGLKPVDVIGAGIYLSQNATNDPNYIYSGSFPNPNPGLSINRANLTNLCDEMWPGIKSDIPEIVGGQYQVDISESQIRNAYAVFEEKIDPNSWTLGSSNIASPFTFRLRNSTINHCYNGAIFAASNTLKDVRIIENDFKGSSSLAYPYDKATTDARASIDNVNPSNFNYRSHTVLDFAGCKSNMFSNLSHSIAFEGNTVSRYQLGIRVGQENTNMGTTSTSISGNTFENITLHSILNQNASFEFEPIVGNTFIDIGGTLQQNSNTDFYDSEQILEIMSTLGARPGTTNPSYDWHSAGIKSETGIIAEANNFSGSGNPTRSVGILSLREGLNAHLNTFNELRHAILTYARNPTITENKFYNNLEGINVGPHGSNGNYLSTTLNLRCNYFEKWSNDLLNQTHYGLVIQDGTNLNDIGGDFFTTSSLKPNANVWPATNRSQTFGQWTSPSNWQSLLWGNGVSGKYWRYGNEFVGNNQPTFYTNIIRTPLQPALRCTEVLGGGDGVSIIEVCNGNLPYSTQPYFPLREGAGTTTGLGSDQLNENLAVYPNPATNQFAVLHQWAPNSIVVLTLVDALGKVVLEQKIAENDPLVNIEKLPSGLYQVKMVTEGSVHHTTLLKQ